VDRLLGEYQTVIKPLGRLFAGLKGIAGSTILGSGDVALILDVPALVAAIHHEQAAALKAIPDTHIARAAPVSATAAH
jgi:two-component system, chemotaxis family, sensor kinase CheA